MSKKHSTLIKRSLQASPQSKRLYLVAKRYALVSWSKTMTTPRLPHQLRVVHLAIEDAQASRITKCVLRGHRNVLSLISILSVKMMDNLKGINMFLLHRATRLASLQLLTQCLWLFFLSKRTNHVIFTHTPL